MLYAGRSLTYDAKARTKTKLALKMEGKCKNILDENSSHRNDHEELFVSGTSLWMFLVSLLCVCTRERACVVRRELHSLKTASRPAELGWCRRGEAQVGRRCSSEVVVDEKRGSDEGAVRRGGGVVIDWPGQRPGKSKWHGWRYEGGGSLVAHEQMHELSFLPDDRCIWGCLEWREGHAALGNVFDGMYNDEGMYEMRIGSFLRGVYDGIFVCVGKRHWKKEGRKAWLLTIKQRHLLNWEQAFLNGVVVRSGLCGDAGETETYVWEL